jgi:hypothetical protein
VVGLVAIAANCAYSAPIVELSDQAFAVPAVARVLKFSVRGVSSVVMLPLFVYADDGRSTREMAMPIKTNNDNTRPTRRVR